MSARMVVLAALGLGAAPVAAQTHDMHGMPGMTMPAAGQAAKPRPRPAKRAPARTAKTPASADAASPPVACAPEHAAMGHCAPAPQAALPAPRAAAMPETAPCPPAHAAMGHCTPAEPAPAPAPAGTDQAAGDAPPPAPPTDLAAARFHDAATMAAANRRMRDEHGGMRFAQILFNLAEVQARRGADGYRWDGEGWFGGDIDRVVLKSEGDGRFGGGLGDADVEALYARAVDPYWTLQIGVRQAIGGDDRRTYATLGIEGLAPYWFDVEARVFVSGNGDVLARGEAWYDQRITQRAILQPRVAVTLAAQDGPGVSEAEIGVRLRYEIAREFAPYVGVAWARRAAAGGGGVALALGVRGWF